MTTLVTGVVVLANTASAAEGTMTPVPAYTQGNNYGYWEYLPPQYDGVTPMPVLVFLSGIGEVGTGMIDGPCFYPTYGPSFNGTADLCNNLRHGPPLLIWQSLNTGNEAAWPDADRPFIMIAPQNTLTYEAYSVVDLEQFFNYVQDMYAVDESRMYLTGMSQGGRSTLLYLEQDPDRFAATIMTAGVASFDHLQNPCPLTRSAFWAFHGENDGQGGGLEIFQPSTIVNFVNAFNACPAPRPDARMTMYLNAGHNVWTRTFNPADGMNRPVDAAYDPYDINMYDWLLDHDKPQIDAEPDFTAALDEGSFVMSAVVSDDDAYELQWQQVAGPPSAIQGDTSANATVFPSGVGDYTFEVSVIDSDGQWEFDEIVVTVPPEAEGGESGEFGEAGGTTGLGESGEFGETGGTTGLGESGVGGGESGDYGESDDGAESGEDGADSDDGADPMVFGHEIYTESFDGLDGALWPDPWIVGNAQVISSEITDHRGEFNAVTGALARMALPGFSATDIDITFSVTFEQYFTQGAGFSVRQSLHPSTPQGYTVYLEGGYSQSFSVWRQLYGSETPLVQESIVERGYQSGQPYQVRFQCFMEGGQTRLRARVWAVDELEPDTWLIDVYDDTPELQDSAGSFSFDLYNYAGTGSVQIDDLVITQRVDPTVSFPDAF